MAQGSKTSAPKLAAPRRRQLHILYLLNDLLHDSLHHRQDAALHAALAGNLQTHLGDLVAHAAAHKTQTFPRQHKRLTDLLDLWQRNAYYPASYIDKLRAIAAEAGKQGTAEGLLGLDAPGAASAGPGEAGEKKAPYTLPNYHGDPAAPYYELPAATMLPHIRARSGAPINPQNVKALHFGGGPAGAELARAVQDFLADAEALYAPTTAGNDDDDDDEGVSLEMDDIGLPVRRDKETRELLDGESYYGWSKRFCRRMGGAGGDSPGRGRGRSRSSSSDRSRSRSPAKRRRYSSDDSRSASRDHPRRRSYSPSRSRSRSPPRRSRFRSRSRSRSGSYSPPQQMGLGDFRPPVPPPQPAPAMPFPSPFPHGMPPLGPDGMPLPPPRPVGWQGPWPPPPPPLPGATGQFGGGGSGMMGTGSGGDVGGVYGGSSDPRLNNRR